MDKTMDEVYDIYGHVEKLMANNCRVNIYGHVNNLQANNCDVLNYGHIDNDGHVKVVERTVVREVVKGDNMMLRHELERSQKREEQLRSENETLRAENFKMRKMVDEYLSDVDVFKHAHNERVKALITANHQAADRIRELEHELERLMGETERKFVEPNRYDMIEVCKMMGQWAGELWEGDSGRMPWIDKRNQRADRNGRDRKKKK